jgi:acyl carrier protein
VTGTDLLDLVRETLGIVCERPPADITRDSRLADLGADSLARVELADIVEERLASYRPDLHIPDADLEAFTTVGDVVDHLARELSPALGQAARP